MNLKTLFAAAAAVAALAATPAWSAYPDRPIRLLVGYALAVPWTPRRASSPNTWATSWDSP